MDISIIVAVDEQGGIGKNGTIPWNLMKSDQQLFRQRTMGHFVFVGQRTWDLMKATLKGRKVLVLTNDDRYVSSKPVFAIVHSIEEALAVAQENCEEELFVIGGASVYEQTITLVNRLYITIVHGIFGCDTFFPRVNYEVWHKNSTTSFIDVEPAFDIEEYVRQ
jgi:dihydrofolate reductase